MGFKKSSGQTPVLYRSWHSLTSFASLHFEPQACFHSDRDPPHILSTDLSLGVGPIYHPNSVTHKLTSVFPSHFPQSPYIQTSSFYPSTDISQRCQSQRSSYIQRPSSGLRLTRISLHDNRSGFDDRRGLDDLKGLDDRRGLTTEEALFPLLPNANFSKDLPRRGWSVAIRLLIIQRLYIRF